MSIRPIDFQVSIPRSGEAARANNNLTAKPEQQQQIFAQQLEKQVALDSTQVVESNKTEFNTVDKDGKNSNEQKKKKKDDKDKQKNKPKQNHASTSIYDISI